MFSLGVSLVGVALALLNVRGSLRIWRSGVYERRQLIAQTVLIWLVPGSVFLIVSVLKDARPALALDPTTENPESANANIVAGAVRLYEGDR